MTTAETSRNLEDFVVIWLDATLKTKNIADYVAKESDDLRRIVNYLKLYVDPDNCIEYMTSPVLHNEKIFLVVSGSLGQDFVPRIHSTVRELYLIYIFCSYVTKHEKWAKNFSKIKGVYKDMTTLCEQLQHDTIQCINDLIDINISSTKDEALLSYNQLWKQLESINSEETRTNLLIDCRQLYADNEVEKEIIENFAIDYHPDRAIWWYERTNIFLHRILSKALRTQDMSVLVDKLAFFIQDLHQQQQLLQYTRKHYPLIVYRGFGMSVEVFERLQQNKFLYVTNILTASIDVSLERDFAIQAVEVPNKVAVLLQIEAMISNAEQYKVVFPINTIFIIQAIENVDNSEIHTVRLLPLFV